MNYTAAAAVNAAIASIATSTACKSEGYASRVSDGMLAASRPAVFPCVTYKGLNTPEGYAAAPAHVREAWDKMTAK